jgi:hypothetical protein
MEAKVEQTPATNANPVLNVNKNVVLFTQIRLKAFIS